MSPDPDLPALHAAARGTDPALAYAAIQQLGEIFDPTAETIEIVIDAMTSDLEVQGPVDSFASVSVHRVADLAVEAVKRWPKAIDELNARIVNPAQPGDDKLLERSVPIGRPMFDLARILVTDGDARRSRAAEPIVAQFVYELEIDEAISVYLSICDRERHARVLPVLLRRLWPRLGTVEGKAAIARRWTERGLSEWIDERLDREPIVACALLALLIAGPPETDTVIRELVKPMAEAARWISIESLLVVDPVRTGAVFATDPLLGPWMVSRATWGLRSSPRELELRLVIACGNTPSVIDALVASRAFGKKRLLDLLRDVGPTEVRAALAARIGSVDGQTAHAIRQAIAACDGATFTGLDDND